VKEQTQETASVEGFSREVYRKAGRKAAVLAVVLVVIFWVAYFSPLKDEVRDLATQVVALRRAGPGPVAVYIFLVTVLVAVGMPRLVLYCAGGFLFGFWWGLLASEAGTVLGSYALFLFVRWGGRDWVLHRWPGLRRWAQGLRSAGIPAVLIMRQVPVAGIFVNLALGLSHIRNRDFLLGTAVGLLPEGVPATLIGAGMMHGRPQVAAAVAAVSVALLAAAWILWGLVAGRRRVRPVPEEDAAAVAGEQTSTG